VPEIVDNQRYLVAIEVRKINTLSFKYKKELYEKLLEGVTVRGTINTLIDIEDILSSVNVNKIFKLL
jgi:hypothetical protein